MGWDGMVFKPLYTSIPPNEPREILIIFDGVDRYYFWQKYFKFNGQIYFQTNGVSMELAFAPNVATLIMYNLEKIYILNQQTNPFFKFIYLTFYKWYLGNVIIILDDGNRNQEFFFFNGCDPFIAA